MREWIMMGYELLTVLLPGAALLWVRRRKGGDKAAEPVGWITAFAVYWFAVLHVTGAGTVYDAIWRGISVSPERINLIPFSHGIDLTGCVLNVLLFVPMGMFLGCAGEKAANVKWTTLTGFFASLAIELSQLLNNRRPDVDDLLMNTVGACLGFLIVCIIGRMRQWKGAGRAAKYVGALPLYAVVMFAGRFFLFHELWIAGLLYGF